MNVTITPDDKSRVTSFTLRDDNGTAIGSTEVAITARGYGYLRRMQVAERHRGQGGGRALLAAVLEYFGHTTRLELIISDHGNLSQSALARFYENAGFRYGPSADISRKPRKSDIRRMFRNPR
jgi:GNAT superfamily N-acetyltransferase